MYNRSEIMKAAHQLRNSTNAQYKKEYNAFVAAHGEETAKRLGWDRKMTMAEALRAVWADAKFAAVHTNPKEALFLLKMKDRWTQEDHELARRLSQAIAA